MSDKIMLKFWGVRGSHAVPGSHTVRFGGNTPCVEIRVAGQTLILDAGTGLIQLGKDLVGHSQATGEPVEAALFFSHLHHDHTQGFPFFTPAFLPGTSLRLFGPGIFEQNLEGALSQAMSPPAFPVKLGDMAAAKTFYHLSDGSVVDLGKSIGEVKLYSAREAPAATTLPGDVVRVRALRSYAHPGGVLIYRIEWQGQAIVYATDTEGYINTDQRLAGFAREANILIHDAQYTEEHYCGQKTGLPATQGWGHSTAPMACSLAQTAGVKQLLLFHHDPNYNDDTIAAIESQARQIFPNTLAAFEGLEIEIPTAAPTPFQALATNTARLLGTTRMTF